MEKENLMEKTEKLFKFIHKLWRYTMEIHQAVGHNCGHIGFKRLHQGELNLTQKPLLSPFLTFNIPRLSYSPIQHTITIWYISCINTSLCVRQFCRLSKHQGYSLNKSEIHLCDTS